MIELLNSEQWEIKCNMSKTRKQKSIVKQPKITPKDAKLRKKPQYKSFRLHKRIKHPGPKLPNWWTIFLKSLRLLRANIKPLLLFLLLYSVITIILVRGIAPLVDIEGLKESYEEFGLEIGGFTLGLTAFGSLLQASTQNVNAVAQLYQMILLIVASLAFIWLFRQQQAGNKVTMKMAFYRGMYPLIPFTLLILLIALQLIPATIGNFLFATVTTNQLVVGFFEQFAWVMLFIFTILLSLYWISSSLIALFVVTLPEMTPMMALREAKELVRYRRVSVLLKIIALIFIIIAALIIIVLPLIFFQPLVAEWVFFALTIIAVPFCVSYLFCLYRELL